MKEKKKYYVAVIGRVKRPTIYDNYDRYKKKINHNAKENKVFYDLSLAVKYAKKFCEDCEPNINVEEYKKNSKTKVCTICKRVHKCSTQSCQKCHRGKKKHQISIGKAIYLQKKYPSKYIFDTLDERPWLVYERTDKYEMRKFKNDSNSVIRSYNYRTNDYSKWDGEVPSYVLNDMKKYPSKKFLSLSGNRLSPNVHYICLRCNEEQVAKVFDLGEGHNCSGLISSGEALVKDYLSNKYEFVTQRDTFRCINPITRSQLPYDFELVEKKILIEVQGKQHYEFINHFHGTIENFHYQQRKDAYKKKYAIKYGYNLVEIDYDDFKNDLYINKIEYAVIQFQASHNTTSEQRSTGEWCK